MTHAHKASLGHILGAIFLIAGTCIGGGMLALPVMTAQIGFFPSTVLMAVCWLFMTATALLYAEASLWMEPGAHVLTISTKLLGRPGKVIAGVIYLFIAYASLVAYISGGAELVTESCHQYFGWQMPTWGAALAFCLLFGFVIDMGAEAVGRVNTILFVALLVAYVVLVALGTGEIRASLLTQVSWISSFSILPLMLTIFSFQAIVPSLTPYLKRDAYWIKRCIFLGTTVAFLVYLIWQWIVLGTVELEGPQGLIIAKEQGRAVTTFFRGAVSQAFLADIAEAFAFFALVTSFLGIAWGLFDFLADGLRIERRGVKKIFLALLVVIPSLLCALNYPRAFLVALDTTGGFGDAILNGILPVLMVWVGRYHQKRSGMQAFRGGKAALIVVALFALFVLASEFAAQWQMVIELFS